MTEGEDVGAVLERELSRLLERHDGPVDVHLVPGHGLTAGEVRALVRRWDVELSDRARKVLRMAA